MKPNNSRKAKAMILSIFIHSGLVLIVAMAGFEYFKNKKETIELTVGNDQPAQAPIGVTEVATQSAPIEPELPKSLPDSLPEKKSEVKTEPVKQAELPKPVELKKQKAPKKVVKAPAPAPTQTLPTKKVSKSIETVKDSPVAAKNSDDDISIDEKELPQAMAPIEQPAEQPIEKIVEHPVDQPTEQVNQAEEEKLAEVLPEKKTEEPLEEIAAVPAQEETPEEPAQEKEQPSEDPQASLNKHTEKETEASVPQANVQDEEDDWTKELQAAALPKAHAAAPGAGAGRGSEGLVRSESELTPVSKNPQAVYPLTERMKKIEGTAVVRFSVNENGQVSNAWLEKSSGSKAIDAEALKTQKSWKYQPGKVGIFQKAWVFRLTGEPEEMPYKIRR